jgi:hypothetical protein
MAALAKLKEVCYQIRIGRWIIDLSALMPFEDESGLPLEASSWIGCVEKEF